MRELTPISDVVVIIDVLSFTTAVEIATACGAIVFPYPMKDDSALDYARAMDATLASADRAAGFSLSPASLRSVPAGHRIVLPSPNGAALCFAAEHPVVLAACLRNAAGERWDSGELRPSLEDLIGAGAVIQSLPGIRSPEAELAVAAFERFREELPAALRGSVSGQELIARGWGVDVDLAAELNVSSNVPSMVNRAFGNIAR